MNENIIEYDLSKYIKKQVYKNIRRLHRIKIYNLDINGFLGNDSERNKKIGKN